MYCDEWYILAHLISLYLTLVHDHVWLIHVHKIIHWKICSNSTHIIIWWKSKKKQSKNILSNINAINPINNTWFIRIQTCIIVFLILNASIFNDNLHYLLAYIKLIRNIFIEISAYKKYQLAIKFKVLRVIEYFFKNHLIFCLDLYSSFNLFITGMNIAKFIHDLLVMDLCPSTCLL